MALGTATERERERERERPGQYEGLHRLGYHTLVKIEWLLVGVLAMGCTNHEAQTGDGAPAEPSGEPASTWVWRADDGSVATSTLVGVVGQQGVSHCPDGGFDRQWLGLHPTLGRVTLSGPDDPVFDPVMDMPVVALGQPKPAPRWPPITQDVEPCPEAQMRSDWLETPRGMLLQRDPVPEIQHFEVAALRPLHELRVEAKGEDIVVTMSNPAAQVLHEVELRVHYEGCFGKPGSTVETTKTAELALGAQIAARVPRLIERSHAVAHGKPIYRAFSVQMVGRAESVTIDLDVRLATLGVAVECPRRR